MHSRRLSQFAVAAAFLLAASTMAFSGDGDRATDPPNDAADRPAVSVDADRADDKKRVDRKDETDRPSDRVSDRVTDRKPRDRATDRQARRHDGPVVDSPRPDRPTDRASDRVNDRRRPGDEPAFDERFDGHLRDSLDEDHRRHDHGAVTDQADGHAGDPSDRPDHD